MKAIIMSPCTMLVSFLSLLSYYFLLKASRFFPFKVVVVVEVDVIGEQFILPYKDEQDIHFRVLLFHNLWFDKRKGN